MKSCVVPLQWARSDFKGSKALKHPKIQIQMDDVSSIIPNVWLLLGRYCCSRICGTFSTQKPAQKPSYPLQRACRQDCRRRTHERVDYSPPVREPTFLCAVMADGCSHLHKWSPYPYSAVSGARSLLHSQTLLPGYTEARSLGSSWWSLGNGVTWLCSRIRWSPMK